MVAELAKLLLLVSIVVAAVLARLLLVASKTKKNERVWQELDDAEPPRETPVSRAAAWFQPNDGKSDEVAPKPQPQRQMWEDSNYCWVVICKNHWFHRRRNLFHGHRIPLGETDAVAPRPAIQGRFNVRCDECHEEYPYSPSDLLRYEQEVPELFEAHPLFRDKD